MGSYRRFLYALFTIFLGGCQPSTDWLLRTTASMLPTSQDPPDRVRHAQNTKSESIKQTLQTLRISYYQFEIALLAFKEENRLELWAKNKSDRRFQLVKHYDICARSGQPGPKNKEGDRQVPEGFYHIDRFNPRSQFYLSLGINYPNAADVARSTHEKLGGDIFIHGGCATVGCLPITDEHIKELYIYALEAKQHGQSRIPVAIFPARPQSKAWEELFKQHSQNKALLDFWRNLQEGYSWFEAKQQWPRISINNKGVYSFY